MVSLLLDQDQIWLLRNGNAVALEDMDPDHRANLIPFLRGNAKTLQEIAGEDDGLPAEDWLEAKPLMRRLCELERGRTIDDRRATHDRNMAHEAATGYQKVRLG